MGGMLGVVWSDGFQFVVLMLGLLLAVPLAMSEFGAGDAARGWQELSSRSDVIFDWTSSNWSWYLIMGQFAWIFAIPVQPHLVTRFLTAKDERNILMALPVCLTAGVVIYTSTVPIGLLGQTVNSTAEDGGYAYIALARNLLSPWLGAFALAGVAAAALSTCSTVLIVTGQSLSREVYQKWITPDASDRQALFAARVAILLVGAITFAIAYFEVLGIFWLVVLSASLLASIFFVPIFAGFFSIKSGGTGALAAMISGGSAAIIVYIINKQFDTHFFVTEFFAGLFFSAIAMWVANRKYPANAEEQSVLKTLEIRHW
jgi:sodium/proline symporter